MKTISFVSIAIAAMSLCACSGTTTGTGTNGNGNGNESGTGPDGTGGSGADGKGGGVASEYDALFDTPSGDATPDSIYGLWGGVVVDGRFKFDTRTRLAESTFTFATKCLVSNKESAVAGIKARARIDETEIAVLESKKDEKKAGDITCRANVQPITVKRCADGDNFKQQCFELAGTELTLYGDSPLQKVEMTKLSD